MSIQLFDLTGKRALVTGSSQGIGYALAQGLKAAGADVILNGRDEAKLKAAAEALSTKHMLCFDATDHEAVRTAVDAFEQDTGSIDILVNNAGMQHRSRLKTFRRTPSKDCCEPIFPRCLMLAKPLHGT